MNACPTAKRLQQWLADVLSEAESQAIEEHVTSCSDVCQPLIDSFSGFEAPGSADAPPAAAGAGISPEPDAALSAVGVSAVPASVKADDTPALQLPGYDILGQLGKGGMGVVYKARHRRMDRLVAIKVLSAAVTQSPDAVARFEREVKAAARLRHPNIVDAHDAAEANGVHFLVMEFIQGSDLAALVRHKGPFEVSRAVDCVLQVARGLDYAHRQGVVHRDVKPSNLLLDGEGVVKVLDMGLARFETTLGAEVTELTGMGQIMGTVDYMAPEQALDTRHADARSDIYSLGVTLWYLLTGRPAFFGENALARLLAHREQPIPSLCSVCPTATPALEAVFMKMVAKKPEDRYQTMSAVIAALEGCRRAAAEERTSSWTSSEDGLSRPSRDPDSRAASAVSAASPSGTAASAVPAFQQRGAAVLHAAPSVEATLTLNAAESDTDPNTEQSLDVSASALTHPPRRGGKLVVAAALLGLAALAAAFVIHIQSGEGNVVVESEVDGISVDILRNGQPVKEDWQIHAGTDNRWHVRTGTVEVKLPANLQGEFTLDQDTASLVRDGKIVVKIARAKKPDIPAVVAKDANRAVAEWALERGLPIAIVSPPGTPASSVTSVEQLPRSFDLWSLGISCPPHPPISEKEFISQVRRVRGDITQLGADDIGLSDAGLQELTNIPALANLGALEIRNGAITDDGLARLSAFAKLNNLIVVGHLDVTPNGIAQLRALPKLKYLTLNQIGLTDAHLAELRGTKLEGLDVQLNPGIADEGVAHLAEMRSLRHLNLRRTQIGDQGLQSLRELVDLKLLLVDGTRIGDQGLQSLRELVDLESLAIDLTNIGENGLAMIPVFRKLKRLSVYNLPLTGELLRRICELPHLEFLHLGGEKMRLRGADLASLEKVPQLKTLVVGWAGLPPDVVDDWWEPMSKLSSLTELDLWGARGTAADIQKLHVALPRCRIISDHGTIEPVAPLHDRAVAEWALQHEDPNRAVAEWALERGVPISIVTTPGASAFSVTSVEQLPRSFDLWSLGMSCPPHPPISEKEFISQVGRVRGNIMQLGADDIGLSDAGLQELTNIPALANLGMLEIRNGAITDDGLARLSAFANLSNLNIYGHFDVTPSGIAQLRALPKLKYLAFGLTTVSDAHLAGLRGMDLEFLALANCREVTASGMTHLVGMQSLGALGIQGTQVPTSALPQLRHLPRLCWLVLSASQADDDWAGLRPLQMLRSLELIGATSRDLTQLAELPQLRTIWFHEDVAIDEGDRAALARKNPLCRVIVGWALAKTIGDDHPRALAERLQNRGAKLFVRFYSHSSPSHDLHSNDGPVVIDNINLPPHFALDDEDRRLLAALDFLYTFSAPSIAEADRCAAALGETPTLVREIDLTDSDLTDEGLARLSTQPMLERLHIRGTKVTSAGVEAFKKALPDCNIEWEPPTATEGRKRAAAE